MSHAPPQSSPISVIPSADSLHSSSNSPAAHISPPQHHAFGLISDNEHSSTSYSSLAPPIVPEPPVTSTHHMNTRSKLGVVSLASLGLRGDVRSLKIGLINQEGDDLIKPSINCVERDGDQEGDGLIKPSIKCVERDGLITPSIKRVDRGRNGGQLDQAINHGRNGQVDQAVYRGAKPLDLTVRCIDANATRKIEARNTMNLLNDGGEMASQQMIPGLSGGLENPRAPNVEDEWETRHRGPWMRKMKRGSGADMEKDPGDATKTSGVGGGAAPAAAQPKIAYSNHPFSSQFKYVRAGAAPGGFPGQVRRSISMEEVSRNEGDVASERVQFSELIQQVMVMEVGWISLFLHSHKHVPHKRH
ncbi:hypothetical protein SASPL_112024 [Salvia splendens]|uniref:Uncharacterized protein n=1 Tax=Salvia splendens TaxID=180675 RepID=A0A8X8YBU8_SALSN|nr:hypothetical protein SASPL_112024 [Salvia splendens]